MPRGSFFGLVGPNGAGKTTSPSMAVGPLRPDGGSARIFGVDVWADPVAAATIRTILRRFVDAGGSVVLSAHVMALVEQLCDRVGVITRGRLVAAGTLDEVRGQGSLEDAFVRLVGAITTEGLSWLAS